MKRLNNFKTQLGCFQLLGIIIYFPWIEETRNIRLAIRSALSNFALSEIKENVMLISRFPSLYFVFKLFISPYFLNHWHESIEITSMFCWRGVLQTCRLGSCTNSSFGTSQSSHQSKGVKEIVTYSSRGFIEDFSLLALLPILFYFCF